MRSVSKAVLGSIAIILLVVGMGLGYYIGSSLSTVKTTEENKETTPTEDLGVSEAATTSEDVYATFYYVFRITLDTGVEEESLSPLPFTPPSQLTMDLVVPAAYNGSYYMAFNTLFGNFRGSIYFTSNMSELVMEARAKTLFPFFNMTSPWSSGTGFSGAENFTGNATINVKIYDKNGNVIGTGSTLVTSVSNSTWEYVCTVKIPINWSIEQPSLDIIGHVLIEMKVEYEYSEETTGTGIEEYLVIQEVTLTAIHYPNQSIKVILLANLKNVEDRAVEVTSIEVDNITVWTGSLIIRPGEIYTDTYTVGLFTSPEDLVKWECGTEHNVTVHYNVPGKGEYSTSVKVVVV